MGKKYFMGIDIGTNESKGVLIDEECRIIQTASASHGLENPKPGYFEHDAEAVWWGDFCKISRELIRKSGVAKEEIKGVGASALSADVVPVDESCRPLRRAILYGIDARAVKEMEYITEYYGAERTQKLLGHELCSSDCMPKILWIKNNEPDIYARTYKFLTASSYLTAKLTDQYVIDRYLAISSFGPCYRQDLSIDEELTEELYCRKDQLAEGRETAETVGFVTEKAAEETGLAAGTPVVTGTDDSGAEAISTGVLKPGDLMVQIGSTCYIMYCSDRLIEDGRIWSEDFLIPGTFCVDGGTNAAGSLTKWVRDTMYSDVKESGTEEPYAVMAEKAAEIPAGSEGILVLPYFAGERTPINDSRARGMIFGSLLHHTRDHINRAVLEGVGYSIAQHIDIIEEHGLEIRNFMCVGGGTKNPTWLQIIADITGKNVKTAEITIGASYGDAMIAAIGTGCIKDYGDLEQYIKSGQTYTPDEAAHRVYQPLKEMYTKLYRETKETMHALSEIYQGAEFEE
ncbi:MAG: FGGY-family carbohydrate kinase [Ruminococcus sp.]|nr:FGGY-family carbohydrate kinase [Ruminococcus sp.]